MRVCVCFMTVQIFLAVNYRHELACVIDVWNLRYLQGITALHEALPIPILGSGRLREKSLLRANLKRIRDH